MAALSPFLVLHYEQLGLDGRQIGLLAGIPPALILLGAAGWGALADASQRHRAVLAVAIAGTIAAVVALSVAQTFTWLIAIVIFMALMQSPITPVVDNSVLHALGEYRDRYGRIRIWGAIGWGACGPVAGHLVERFGLAASFSTYLVLFAICFCIALFLPIAHVRVPAFWSGLKALVGDRRWRLFLFLAFASGVDGLPAGVERLRSNSHIVVPEMPATAWVPSLLLGKGRQLRNRWQMWREATTASPPPTD